MRVRGDWLGKGITRGWWGEYDQSTFAHVENREKRNATRVRVNKYQIMHKRKWFNLETLKPEGTRTPPPGKTSSGDFCCHWWFWLFEERVAFGFVGLGIKCSALCLLGKQAPAELLIQPGMGFTTEFCFTTWRALAIRIKTQCSEHIT